MTGDSELVFVLRSGGEYGHSLSDPLMSMFLSHSCPSLILSSHSLTHLLARSLHSLTHLLLAGHVHAPELAPSQRLANVEIREAPPLALPSLPTTPPSPRCCSRACRTAATTRLSMGAATATAAAAAADAPGHCRLARKDVSTARAVAIARSAHGWLEATTSTQRRRGSGSKGGSQRSSRRCCCSRCCCGSREGERRRGVAGRGGERALDGGGQRRERRLVGLQGPRGSTRVGSDQAGGRGGVCGGGGGEGRCAGVVLQGPGLQRREGIMEAEGREEGIRREENAREGRRLNRMP